jgi:two-component system sensor histidine kinase SenX3
MRASAAGGERRAEAMMPSRPLVRRVQRALERLGTPAHPEQDSVAVDEPATELEDEVETSEQRSAEADVLHEQLRAALAAVDQGVVIADATGAVVFRNERAAAFAGARHGDALAERSVAALLDAAVRGEPKTERLELYGPPRRTLSISATPIVADGARLGAVATVYDVSERARLDAIRRDFVANVSHELKTPVGALALLAEALQDEDDGEVIRRLVSRVHAESMRLSRLIDDLLDLSRIEDDETPRRDPVAVDTVVTQAIERVQSVADSAHIEIHFTEAADSPVVAGDSRQLVSAMQNLLENAIKYSDPGSRVEITVRTKPGFAEIDVRDHGIGIPARDLDRIFERFYRVDRARARDTGGTGLGLAIVRHVADNHRGRVTVSSQEGDGSTFTLALPVLPTMTENHSA